MIGDSSDKREIYLLAQEAAIQGLCSNSHTYVSTLEHMKIIAKKASYLAREAVIEYMNTDFETLGESSHTPF